MRILVCGGRDYRNYDEMWFHLDHHIKWDDVIVTGGAKGADNMAFDYAVTNGISVEKYPADWAKHGKAAGPIRNQQMLDTEIDLVVAFKGGVGTADMVRRAKKANVKVIEI